jgi:hypothetical protein
MNYCRAVIGSIVVLFFGYQSEAQEHNNLWFRTTLSLNLNPKLKVDLELQNRWQNEFEKPANIDKLLMMSFRNWIFYQHSQEVRFSVSPLALFNNYKIIQNKADEMALPNKEFRLSAAIEMQHMLTSKIPFIYRSALEYRIFNNSSPISRFRNRFGILYIFSPKFRIGAYNEILVNVEGTNLDHFFDHNRTSVDLEYQLVSNIKLNLGFIKILRQPLYQNTIISEHNVFFNLLINMPSLKK